jgi:hypothetical protein
VTENQKDIKLNSKFFFRSSSGSYFLNFSQFPVLRYLTENFYCFRSSRAKLSPNFTTKTFYSIIIFKKYRAFVDTLTPEEHRKPKKEKKIYRKQSAVSTTDSSSQIKSTKRKSMSARTSVMSNRRFSARNSKMSVKESVAFTPSSDNQEIERKTPDIVESSSDEEEAYLYFNSKLKCYKICRFSVENLWLVFSALFSLF